MNIIFASYGNDSIALIQLAHEKGMKEVTVAYSDTGWAADYWPARVVKAEEWAQSLGFKTVRIPGMTMEELVEWKKAWPRGGGGKYQFCTMHLKELPALEWMSKIDPDGDAVCMVGIRRCESANRALFPEWTEESEAHGMRSLHAPLVRHDDEARNTLILKTPMPILATRSKECWPCVNARQPELKQLQESAIVRIEVIEQRAGINSKGNPRVMFSPKRHGGAVGIRAVVEHAKKNSDDLFSPGGCDGGWCGS
ncbi:MAG: phosphoadenosine phosphosulfate reductase family protein [Pseudomonadota bacterium]